MFPKSRNDAMSNTKKDKIKPQFFSKRKQGLITVLAVLVLFVLVGGCASYSGPDAMEEVDSVAPDEAPAEMIAEERGIEAPREVDEEAGTVAEFQEDRRYVIYNAHLELEVEDIEQATEEIRSRVEELGGYVSSLAVYQLREDRKAGQMTLRVPEKDFAMVLSYLKEAAHVKDERLDTDDVTRRYIDLEARIANLEVQEERMRELLDRADTIEEILEIEKELGRLRGDLEAMQADFKHLSERVSYATINLSMQERDPRTQVATSEIGSSGEKIMNLLTLNTNRVLQGATNLLIVTIGSLPIVIPLLVLGFLAWRGYRILVRRRNKEE